MSDEPSGLAASDEAADASFDDTPVGGAVQTCPPAQTEQTPASSWIEIELLGEDDTRSRGSATA